MIFAVPLVYHPLSKCHREIYKCMSCQTKLILVQGFSVGGKKIHIYYRSMGEIYVWHLWTQDSEWLAYAQKNKQLGWI